MNSVKKRLQEKLKTISSNLSKLPDDIDKETVNSYNNIINHLFSIESEMECIKTGDIYTADYNENNRDFEKCKSIILACILSGKLNDL